ncbi:MAG: hypothetical protein WB919_06060 [Candidatus Sulfotelmatobacter sp.]
MDSAPDFHDGYVDGVLLSQHEARILLRTVAGRQFTLLLNELERLRVNDLKEGNIIFEINFFEPRQLAPDFIFEVYEYSDESWKKFVLDEWVEKATRKSLTAIKITPSYGCTILAISRGYTLLDGRVLQ